MKKVIVSFLILIFLCANTSIGQLLKIPNLIEHFNEHKNDTDYTAFSFIDFVKLHYAKNSKHHHEDHHELPFKTIENSINILFVFSELNFQVQSVNCKIKFERNYFYQNTFASKLITSIWLPPKLF